MTKHQHNFRLDDVVYEYLTEAAIFHECNRTEFLSELIINEEYVEVNLEQLSSFQVDFNKLGTNINQIARILNTSKKQESILTNEQYEEIKRIYDKLSDLISLHALYDKELLKKIYKLKIVKKKRVFEEMDEGVLEGDEK